MVLNGNQNKCRNYPDMKMMFREKNIMKEEKPGDRDLSF